MDVSFSLSFFLSLALSLSLSLFLSLSISPSFFLSLSLSLYISLSLSLYVCYLCVCRLCQDMLGYTGIFAWSFEKKIALPVHLLRQVDFLCFPGVFSEVAFRGAPRAVFLWFSSFWVSLGRSLFKAFCEKYRFSKERGISRFRHTPQCFGAIFVVWPSQECMKCGKKGLWKLVFF